MDRPALLKKLDAILEEWGRARQWGSIEIVLQSGEAVTLHESRTTKLREGNTRYERPTERR